MVPARLWGHTGPLPLGMAPLTNIAITDVPDAAVISLYISTRSERLPRTTWASILSTPIILMSRSRPTRANRKQRLQNVREIAIGPLSGVTIASEFTIISSPRNGRTLTRAR
jgi:hypothetical protein